MVNLLEIKKLCRYFDGIIALENFSLDLRQNEILGIIGPNGAGKSTLFNILSGFISSNKGYAIFNEENILGLSPDKVCSLGISRTFQDLRLIRQITVLENVLLSFKNQSGEKFYSTFFQNRKSKLIEKHNIDQAIKLLKKIDIIDKKNELAENLSFGQQKLLSIICCLANDAKIFLFDEPFAGLNTIMIDKIVSIIENLPNEGKSVILIEHNIEVVMKICNRIVFMDAGKKVCEGLPEEVRNNPQVIDAYLE